MKYSLHRLNAIALLFVILGTASWIQFAWTLFDSASFVFGLEMLLLPAGYGLLQKRDRWRRISKSLVVVGMLVVVTVPILGFFLSPEFDIHIMGTTPYSGSVSVVLVVIAYSVLLLGCLVWIYRVLEDKVVLREFVKK